MITSISARNMVPFHDEAAGDKPELVLREMTSDDLSEVMEIERACFPQPWSKLHFLSSLYKKPVAQCWVAASEERIVGFIIAWYISRYSNEPGEMHIHNIAVSPDKRRSGIGRQLMGKAVKYGAQQGCEIISLEVRATNHAAKRFYERFGFAMIGIRPNYYEEEDALVLEANMQTILTKFQEQE